MKARFQGAIVFQAGTNAPPPANEMLKFYYSVMEKKINLWFDFIIDVHKFSL